MNRRVHERVAVGRLEFRLVDDKQESPPSNKILPILHALVPQDNPRQDPATKIEGQTAAVDLVLEDVSVEIANLDREAEDRQLRHVPGGV